MPAPEDLQQARMAICESCQELTTLNRCQQCGCFMTLKTRLIGDNLLQGVNSVKQYQFKLSDELIGLEKFTTMH